MLGLRGFSVPGFQLQYTVEPGGFVISPRLADKISIGLCNAAVRLKR